MHSLRSALPFGFVALVLFAGLLSLTVGEARAEGVFQKRVTPTDNEKLSKFKETRDQALAEARSKGAKEDLAVLDKVLAGEPLSLHDGFNPSGAWRCRTIKLGKGLPIVIYGWFDCRISDDGAGWLLEKLSGSQRTSGRFYDKSEKEMYYLGVLSVLNDPKAAYGSVADRNQVAIAVRPGADRLRLEFPSPVYDSVFDIIELERKK